MLRFLCIRFYLYRQLLQTLVTGVWRSGDRASWSVLIIQSTRCTNFSNLFFGIKLYMFRRVLLSIISFSLYTQQWYMSYRFAGSLRAGSVRSSLRNYLVIKLLNYIVNPWIPSWSCSQAVSKPVWHIPLLCVQWKTPDDGSYSLKHSAIYFVILIR